MDELFMPTHWDFGMLQQQLQKARNAYYRLEEKHEGLRRDYNDLVDRYNALLGEKRGAVAKVGRLSEELGRLSQQLESEQARRRAEEKKSEILKEDTEELKWRLRQGMESVMDAVFESFRRDMLASYGAATSRELADRLEHDKKVALNLWIWALRAVCASLAAGVPVRIRRALAVGDLEAVRREADYLSSLLVTPDLQDREDRKDELGDEKIMRSLSKRAWELARAELQPALESGLIVSVADLAPEEYVRADFPAFVFRDSPLNAFERRFDNCFLKEQRKALREEKNRLRVAEVERWAACNRSSPFWRDAVNVFFLDLFLKGRFIPHI